MIKHISAIQNKNYMTVKSQRLPFNANKDEDKVDKFEKLINNPNKKVAKTSIWAGIATTALTLGLMIFTKRGRAWDWYPHEYVTVPGGFGAAVALLTNFIGNNISSNKK